MGGASPTIMALSLAWLGGPRVGPVPESVGGRRGGGKGAVQVLGKIPPAWSSQALATNAIPSQSGLTDAYLFPLGPLLLRQEVVHHGEVRGSQEALLALVVDLNEEDY